MQQDAFDRLGLTQLLLEPELLSQVEPDMHLVTTLAAALVELGVPAFACTPDLFPELMSAALSGRDLNTWAAAHDLT